MVFRRNYFRTVMASVSAFVSPSRYLADAYVASGVKEGTIEVIWNGVDTGQFDAMRREQHPSGITRFGFLGYFGRHKGVALLLEAAAIVCKSHATRIVLFGAGDQQGSYLRQARALGIESILELPGKVDNREIAAAYAALDVVVLPSIWPENQPVSIVEAMAAGLPVIASRVGGVPELVLNGVTGLLFEAGDVKGLARRMSAMCDGDLRTRVGRAARSLVEDITYSDQAERLLRAYHRFCARPLSAEVLSIIPAEGDLSLPPDVPLPVDCAAGDPAAMSIPRNWLTERQQEVLEARRLRVPVPGAPLRGEDVFGTGLSPQSPQVRAGSPA
jgi:glycosyltransferase involved in cell wall biosynthesis